jgi:hypothetical protein
MLANKFTIAEVSAIRDRLMGRTPDPFAIAEIVQDFVVGRGFGISSNAALDAAIKIGASGYSFAAFQNELEAVALVM